MVMVNSESGNIKRARPTILNMKSPVRMMKVMNDKRLFTFSMSTMFTRKNTTMPRNGNGRFTKSFM